MPALNTFLGPTDPSLVLDLIQLVDTSKSDKFREISEAAYGADSKVKWQKGGTGKERVKEVLAREEQLVRVEERLKQRELFELEEEERKKKEEEEDKFDLAALLAKVKFIKGGGGGGSKGLLFSSKRHYSTVSKIDIAKKAMQHRHSLTMSASQKKQNPLYEQSGSKTTSAA